MANLEKAARFWAETPTNPFAFNEDLTTALILDGQADRARAFALDSIRRTSPWPRPKAHALDSLAGTLAAQCRLGEAIQLQREATAARHVLGGAEAPIFSRLIEWLYLDGRTTEQVLATRDSMLAGPPIDLRYEAEVAPSLAVAMHATGDCQGRCQQHLQAIREAEARGEVYVALMGRVKVGALALEHRARRPKLEAWRALAQAYALGYATIIRPWVRRFAAHAPLALELDDGADLLASLLAWDPDGWRSAAIELLRGSSGQDRETLLNSLEQHANRETVDALVGIHGSDIARTRRNLRRAQASRLYLRTLGGVSLRKGGWLGPVVKVEKRRVRSLLAILGAFAHSSLTRDMAIDLLWPEADADSAVNNLNQTVYQLRRYLDPNYRQGESPEYVISSAEQVGLAEDLVYSDIQEIRRMPDRLASASWTDRQRIASQAIALVKGEFLADLSYETWASRLQTGVHNELRARLLPLAQRTDPTYDRQVALDAASALVMLDPYDEAATVALAEGLELSGQRVAARKVLARFAQQIDSELDAEGSEARIRVLTSAAR